MQVIIRWILFGMMVFGLNLGVSPDLYAQGETPTVLGFSPNKAPPGDTVDIDGMDFTPTPTVQFDGVNIPVQFIDDLTLRFVVPEDIVCGEHEIWLHQNIPDGGGRLLDWSDGPFEFTCMPAIHELMPSSAPPDSNIVIDGAGFFSNSSGPPLNLSWGSRVVFDGELVSSNYFDNDRMSFRIPEDALCGEHTVQIDNPVSFFDPPMKLSNTKTFVVTTPCDDGIDEGGTDDPPNASFSFNPNNPTSGQAVQFNDQSTDTDSIIVSWIWDFDDGNSSSLQNPQYVYATPGTYTVKLTVTDDTQLTDTITKSITITQEQAVTDPPSAAFSFAPNNPDVTEIVQFADQSTDSDGNIVSWRWDFGDGTSSNLQNPKHAYTDDGTFTVSLMVTDNDGLSNSTSQTITVNEEEVENPTLTIFQAIAQLIPNDPSGGNIQNSAQVIGDLEILQAVRMWILSEPVPGTGGQTINDDTVRELIRKWILGEVIVLF